MAALFGDYNTSIWLQTREYEIEVTRKILLEHYPMVSVMLGVLVVLIVPFTIVGNSFVIAGAWRDPLNQLRSLPSTALITSMAVCDLLIGLVVGPLGVVICFATDLGRLRLTTRVTVDMSYTLVMSSVLHILALTVDRVVAVAKPLEYIALVTRKRTKTFAISIWLYSAGIGVLAESLRMDFLFNFVFTLHITLVLITVSILYAVIIVLVHQQAKRVRSVRDHSARTLRLVAERERKVTRAILTVASVFKLSFGPLAISHLIMYTCAVCYSDRHVLVLTSYLTTVLIDISSAVNPYLYAWRMQKYRMAIVKLLDECSACFGKLSGKTYQVGDVPMEALQRPQHNTQM